MKTRGWKLYENYMVDFCSSLQRYPSIVLLWKYRLSIDFKTESAVSVSSHQQVRKGEKVIYLWGNGSSCNLISTGSNSKIVQDNESSSCQNGKIVRLMECVQQALLWSSIFTFSTHQRSTVFMNSQYFFLSNLNKTL